MLRLSSTVVTDDQLLILFNVAYRRLQRIIVELREDFFGEIATADLKKDQLSYMFPSNYLKLKRLEVAYEDPTQTKNWKKCTAIDVKKATKAWDWYRENQPTTNPIYDIHGERIFIAPDGTANQTAGLKLWYIQRLDDLTAESTPKIPESYHPLIAEWAIQSVAFRHRLWEVYTQARILVGSGITSMKRELKEVYIGPIQASLPNESDHGYNL